MARLFPSPANTATSSEARKAVPKGTVLFGLIFENGAKKNRPLWHRLAPPLDARGADDVEDAGEKIVKGAPQ